MRTTLVVGAVLAAALAGACDRPAEAAPDEPAFVAGTTLRLADGRTVALPAAASSAPHGWLSPVAVPSPDGGRVAYRTWTVAPDGAGRPVVRVHDVRTGSDTVLADGTASVAWGPGGRIAYAAGGDDRPAARWSGQIVVQGSAAPEPWTPDRGRYVVVAWAGPHLLAYELDPVGRPALFVLDGPSRRRSLGPGVLVAVSPDGSRAFLADTGDTPTPHVRVVDVGTGAVRARLDVPGMAVGHAGDWSGDRVVAAAWPAPVVFHVRPQDVRVERTLKLDPGVYPVGLREPRLTGGTVIGWAATDDSQEPPVALVRCVVDTGGCTGGPVHPPPGVHPVTNPSRP